MSDEKKGMYWCCSADFGDHEETCANYKPVTAREDQPHCNDCGHAPHVGGVCDYGAAHGFEHDGCKCGPEDQPRPVIQATSDSQPRHLEEWEKPNWNRAPEAQGATCPNCKSDDPLMCKVPIKEFHRHMGEVMLCCPNKFHGGPPQDAPSPLQILKLIASLPCSAEHSPDCASCIAQEYVARYELAAARSTPSPQDCRDDGQLADQLAPLLWEADDWWEANKQELVPEADWAESLWLHMLPKVLEILGSTPSPDQKGNENVDAQNTDNGIHAERNRTSNRGLAENPKSDKVVPDPPPQIVSAPKSCPQCASPIKEEVGITCLERQNGVHPWHGEAAVLAQRFHEAYERLAPEFGYETRKESAKPWAEVPENNRQLMTAVCAEILAGASSSNAALQARVDLLENLCSNKLAWERDGDGPDVPVLQPRYDALKAKAYAAGVAAGNERIARQAAEKALTFVKEDAVRLLNRAEAGESKVAGLEHAIEDLKQCWRQDGRAKEVSELRSERDGLREALRESQAYIEKASDISAGVPGKTKLGRAHAYIADAERIVRKALGI